VVVRSPLALPVALTPAGADSTVTCQFTRLSGRLAAAAGDTLSLHSLRRVRLAEAGTSRCDRGTARLIRTSADSLTVRRFSAGRTVALVVVIGGLIVGLAAAASSLSHSWLAPGGSGF